MDIHSNLEFLCRVCAANTKGKHSVAECVYILKTAGLKDKLDKFLFLKISENDSLPKVLCKSCFRQVEATASLSKIAKHTQQVFRDFLLSNLPKGPSESTNTSEFTSSDFMGKQEANKEKSKKDETVLTANLLALLPPPPVAILPPPAPPAALQNLATGSRKDEVVVNVSVADPLTRDNQQKMISNSQRRQSLLLESRYTPKSIAQKPVAAQKPPKSSANQSVDTTNTTNNTTTATTPALNFYPIKANQQTKQQQPTTQITTFSSGGYVIGRINTANSDMEEPKKINMPLAVTPDNVLQQKRKNLVKALNNIKANNSGQVSLLKSSQQKQPANTQNIPKIPLAEVFNQATEDELPEKIIIAAPKNKLSSDKCKKEPLNLSSKIAAVVTPVVQPTQPSTTATITAVVQQQQPEASTTFSNTSPKPTFPEDILLGRVIRDMDLLKLILKALKWPVNKKNIELQLQRLKNSKFTDIMSDNNLLQDTDLTQLLGPYLAPVLLAAQALQQQQQQILKNTTLNENMSAAYITPTKVSALEAAQAEINKSIPYKLPPETSVQLVPATPEEIEPTQSPPLPPLTNSNASSNAVLKREKQKETKTASVPPQKRQRRAAAQRARDSIVISDEEDASTEEEPTKKPRQRSTKSTANIQIDLNNDFMAQFNLLNGSGGVDANEALMALLQRQKTAIMKNKKTQRRRRNSVSNLITLPASEFDALIDLDDDIVLMEPVTTSSSSDTALASSSFETAQQKTDITNTFVVPSVPLITRPIIKRRKTVIHSSRGRLDLSADVQNKEQTPISSLLISASKEKLLEETINQVATGIMSNSNTDDTAQKSLTKTITNETSLLLPADLSASKSPQQKKLQNKATLGQQLLEAIGLQKISSKAINNLQTEAASTSTANTITVMPNSKQSIQQIRSALKKSLKQAQDQQQQRKKELSSNTANNTIIQDADSTTKPAVKEIVVVEGKGNKSDDGSSMVDVEDQIDKVTLMVRSNDKHNCMQAAATATTTTTSEKQENKEMTKSPTTTKIQERRRIISATTARGTRNIAALDTKDKTNEEPHIEHIEEAVDNNDAVEDNEKSAKEDVENASISSSSAPVIEALEKAKETNVIIKEEILTPKRRGRKRLVDKLQELEAAESNDKDKHSKTSPTTTDKSRTLDKSKDEDMELNTSNIKIEEETASNTTSGRPTRQSKTLSKYYKGPDKPAQGRRSLPSRSTRNR